VATVETGQKVRPIVRDENGDPQDNSGKAALIVGDPLGNGLRSLRLDRGGDDTPEQIDSVIVNIVPEGTLRDEYEDVDEDDSPADSEDSDRAPIPDPDNPGPYPGI
jgi:hypothetical protein